MLNRIASVIEAKMPKRERFSPRRVLGIRAAATNAHIASVLH
jgi:hypothetical protein